MFEVIRYYINQDTNCHKFDNFINSTKLHSGYHAGNYIPTETALVRNCANLNICNILPLCRTYHIHISHIELVWRKYCPSGGFL